jgi:F0F1-type ATP synthase assembly protein I
MHCSGCGKNLKLSRASRAIGIVCGVAAGCLIGHALRKAPWGLNLTVIAATVFAIATLVSLACAKLRPAERNGIVVDFQSPDGD